MAKDPLFHSNEPSGGQQPSQTGKQKAGQESAVDLIRHKINTIYASQETMSSELAESGKVVKPESKHQRYMRKLSTSGKSLAQIQIEWHNYYSELPDDEKREVWQEFYVSNDISSAQSVGRAVTADASSKTQVVTSAEPPRLADKRRPLAIRRRILEQVETEAAKPPKAKSRQRFESLFFGLGIGAVTILIFLFGFFNEYVVAPFIQPSRLDSGTPIILDSNGVAPNKSPEVIIPKIGVQIPVDYSLKTVNEEVIQDALNEAVVHYANTVTPGEIGNTAIFGHSSNNIFNKGKYKFAFVLLNKLSKGDTFYLTKNGKVYAYKVFKTKVVLPNETWVLDPVEGKTATATLITCDPPGTTAHRLVVWGEQISPDPAKASTPSVNETELTQNTPMQLSGKGPSAWHRFWSWLNPFN